MKNFILVLLSCLCVACSVSRQVTPKEESHVEIRTETVFRTDTVIVERPQIIERIQTLDTLSVIDNPYARSEAVVSKGILHHSLEAKAIKESVPVQIKTVYKDSLVYKDRVITETIEVAKPLSWWNSTMIRLGYVLLVLLLLAIARTIYKLIINQKL